MEITIAVILGIIVCVCGTLAYIRIQKDYKSAEAEQRKEESNK